ELKPDSGSVQFVPNDLRIGYLPQGLMVDDATPLQAILYPQLTDIHLIEAQLEYLGEAMVQADDAALPALLDSYGQTLEQLEILIQAIQVTDAEAIVAGLGLAEFDLTTPVGILSG